MYTKIKEGNSNNYLCPPESTECAQTAATDNPQKAIDQANVFCIGLSHPSIFCYFFQKYKKKQIQVLS